MGMTVAAHPTPWTLIGVMQHQMTSAVRTAYHLTTLPLGCSCFCNPQP